MSVDVDRYRLPVELEVKITRMNRYLHVKWNKVKKIYELFLGNKFLFSTRVITGATFQKLQDRGCGKYTHEPKWMEEKRKERMEQRKHDKYL